MIVYLESNFILELVFEQNQASYAEEILKLSESRKIDIAIPAFALIEPFWTINGRANKRDKAYNSIYEGLQEYKKLVPTMKITPIVDPLIENKQQLLVRHRELYTKTIERILNTAIVLEISGNTYGRALAKSEELGLEIFDGLMYFTLLSHLTQRRNNEIKCFTSLNWKDFDLDLIKMELSSFNCSYIPNFKDCKNFLLKNCL